MKSKRLSLLLFAGFVTVLTGCASTSSRRLSTASDFDKVFAACKPAVVECGFGITSASAADGFISAQRALVGGFGEVEVMNIQVNRDGKGCSVQVSVVPPADEVFRSMQKVVDNFTKALRDRVPDVAVSSQ